MNNFNKYSKYYDLMYNDKQYELETNYILSLLQEYKKDCVSILELGSGSGNHAYYLSKYGYNVYGIERSEEMVEISINKKIANFFPLVGDIINFDLNKKFDAAISLFHVFSYLKDNQSVIKCLTNVNTHLNLGAIFIFDVWFTPAVYTQKPEVRIKRLENSEISLTRISESSIDFIQNIVNVNFEVIIENKETRKVDYIKEKHPMRHFSVPELEFYAKTTGFEILLTEEYVTKNIPSEKTWGICIVLKKIKNII